MTMPQLARASDVRTRIVEVAAHLLHEHGPAAVTTRAVAQGAGVQAPAIYRWFGDKDGLLDAVAEHVLATFVATKAETVAAASADEVDPLADLRTGWQTQIDFGVSHPELFTLLSVPGHGPGSPAAEQGLVVLHTRIRRVAATGRLRVSEQRAVDMVRSAGVGAVLTLLSTSTEHRDPGLADAMYDAVLHEILTDAPEPQDDGPVAAAVTLRALTSRLDVLSVAEQQLLAEWLDRTIDRLAEH